MGFNLSDIYNPIKNAITGNPDAVKASYDKQIQASKDAAAQQQQFLMGREAAAQAFYGPLQHMFNAAYGSEGIKAPVTPGGTAGMTPLAAMYGRGGS